MARAESDRSPTIRDGGGKSEAGRMGAMDRVVGLEDRMTRDRQVPERVHLKGIGDGSETRPGGQGVLKGDLEYDPSVG